MPERETKEITTPIGKNKIVLYTYITAREKRDITSVFLKSTKFQVNQNQEVETKDVDIELAQKANDKAMELMVVLVNGEKEETLDKLLDMDDRDYNYIRDVINEITNPEETDKKK